MEHEITYSALIVTSVKTLFALERHKIEYKNVYNPNLLNELKYRKGYFLFHKNVVFREQFFAFKFTQELFSICISETFCSN